MTRLLHVLDSGRQGGSENVALDLAQLAAAKADPRTAILRFHRFLPTATLGSFERADDGLRRDYCTDRSIELVRRLSGGGALYHDAGQLAWTLTFTAPRRQSGTRYGDWLARLIEVAALGLQRLGIAAHLKLPNDIDVAGRKLASGFLGVDGNALLFQGNLFLDDIDVETMLRVLRIPKEKLNPDGLLSARGRFVTLREAGVTAGVKEIEDALAAVWASLLGVEAMWLAHAPAIPERSTQGRGHVAGPADESAEDAGALKAFQSTPGGVLYARIHLNPDGRTIEDAILSGAVQVFPADCFNAVRAVLHQLPVVEVDRRLSDFFSAHPHDMIGLSARDITRVVKLALDRVREQSEFDLTPGQANTLMVHSRDGDVSAADIAVRATVVLVPYCAKPSWCAWRTKEGCVECGLCEVGDAYRLAREHGMRAITIVNFEHLCATLEELRRDEVPAYVGMCCGNFFIKRHYVFERAGIPAVLMDISGANCYELQEEDSAYEGKFVAQAHIDLDVLTRVLRGTGKAGM
jgi:lipoate---protein ligase